jgi:hypothetical protein
MAKKTLFRVEFETEYRILGLFCLEKDYRLCWLLNKHLQFDFKKTIDFQFATGKNSEVFNYPVFIYDAMILQQTFFLVSNQSAQGQIMFPAPRGLNYLMLVKADDSRFDFSQFLKRIRNVPQITAAYMIEEALGRHREEFLYDFELFLAQELKM